MQVTVQVGSTKMVIRELLQLGQGSVIELEKLAGEPMEVLVNNKLVARGEVVVVNEKFGIRLTHLDTHIGALVSRLVSHCFGLVMTSRWRLPRAPTWW